uniref:Uncharacterized protein n=1 Tax=Strigamia maritima TaxID=126957 RepID=T1JAX4_STRMM
MSSSPKSNMKDIKMFPQIEEEPEDSGLEVSSKFTVERVTLDPKTTSPTNKENQCTDDVFLEDFPQVPVIITEDCGSPAADNGHAMVNENGNATHSSDKSSRSSTRTWSGKRAESPTDGRIRRKSGDDVLTSNTGRKTHINLFDAFRPRSKSEASKNKKPTIISSVKNSIQNSLHLHPSSTHGQKNTPVSSSSSDKHNKHDMVGDSHKKTSMAAKVMDMFRSRSHSMTNDPRHRDGSPKIQRHYHYPAYASSHGYPGHYATITSASVQGALLRRQALDAAQRRASLGGHRSLDGALDTHSAILFRESRGY